MVKQKSYTTPPLSVVIAMYNAEKYIAQCLESLLRQTFKDFEVIIVDDCSTDKSVSIVRSFEKKFSGRLELICLKKNSGCPSVPRNTAIKNARGKYITFLDSDDFFTDTALEEMYKIAEETDAEVIHAQTYFQFKDGANALFENTYQRTNLVSAPTLETEDIGARVRKFTEYGFLWWGCNKLIRRDLIIDNAIEFPLVSVYEDMVFTFCLVVCAKKYVRVPNCFYCYRIREGSLSHKPAEPVKTLKDLIAIFEALDNFMSRQEHFIENPQDRYDLLDWHCQNKMNTICKILYQMLNLSPSRVETLFRREVFSNLEDISPVIMSYFFTTSSFYRFKLYQLTEENKQLREDLKLAQLQQKITSFASSSETVSSALNFGQDNSLKLPTDFKLGGDSN